MFHPKGPTLLELARQALSSTDRGYDLLADKFEFTPFRTPDVILERVVELLNNQDEPPAGELRVLDLCCGTGAALRHFATLQPKTLVGIDRSRGMLLEARKQLDAALPERRQNPERLTLVQGDALNLPLEHEALAAPFDLVTCFGAFGHIVEEDEERFVAAVRRVLRPGGRFVFVTGDPPQIDSAAYWVSHTFNAVMRIRNALLKPEFIMFYLTFLLPRATMLLEQAGFEVTALRDVFDPPFQKVVMVDARLSE